MKYLFLTAVIFAISLTGCEKENLEPETVYLYDTVYVNKTDTLIKVIVDTVFSDTNFIDFSDLPNFDFESGFGVWYNTEDGSMNTGLYFVNLTKNSIRVEINDTISFEFNISVINIDENFGIVMGTVWNDFNNVSGSFYYQSDKWFEFDIVYENENIKFYFYN